MTKTTLVKRLKNSRVLVAMDIAYIFGLYTVFAVLHIAVTMLLSYIPIVKIYIKRPVLTKEYIWRRYYYSRIHDCWNRTVTSRAGIWMNVVLDDGTSDSQKSTTGLSSPISRLFHKKTTHNDYKGGKEDLLAKDDSETPMSKRCLNFGSYNYLGFADSPESVIEDDLDTLSRYGNSTCSEYTCVGGCTSVHRELEKNMAEFLRKEDSFIFAMGYATNSTAIPLLISKGGLIISDSMNHASIVAGCRESGAKVMTFKHNDTEDLERIVRSAIVKGCFNMILIIVEGIYSMEGDVCDLPEIARIKMKYKCKLYIDEAHSIGSIGTSGRGVTDYFGKELMDRFGTKDVADVLMGTFTKSFASIGGYIASDRQTVARVRANWCGGVSMPPMSAQQIISALNTISSSEDTRIKNLEENTRYLRKALRECDFVVLGTEGDESHAGSPVVPISMRNPAKMAWLSRTLLRYSIGIVVVGYPAVPMTENRVRLCVSSSLTKTDIDYAVRVMDSLV